jgi:hypothetical protein
MVVVVESSKVKMVKVKFALEQALTAQSLSRRIALLFKLGPRWGWVVHVPIWMGGQNLVPTGIQSPDRPARRKSLYWLSYPDPDSSK